MSAQRRDVRDDNWPHGHRFESPLQIVMDPSTLYIRGRPARNRSILRLVRFTIVPGLMTLPRDSVYPFSVSKRWAPIVNCEIIKNPKNLSLATRSMNFWKTTFNPLTHTIEGILDYRHQSLS